MLPTFEKLSKTKSYLKVVYLESLKQQALISTLTLYFIVSSGQVFTVKNKRHAIKLAMNL